MRVLCDTCSILMVLRIAPAMFEDPRFGCSMLPHVREEIIRNQRFKTRYPWRTGYVGKLKPLPLTSVRTAEWQKTLQYMHTLVRATRNQKTARLFGLSSFDLELAATVVEHAYDICTAERDLADFLEQEFEIGNVSPLHLVNDWIEAGLVEWNDTCQAVLDDWVSLNERKQPLLQIQRFEKLAKRKYPRQ